MILAGDVGGTKCILSVFERKDGKLHGICDESLPSREFRSLEAVVERFLELPSARQFKDRITSSCFGIAGPVFQGRVATTNLPWEITVENLEKASGIPWVHLINDLEAAGYGIAELGAADQVRLNSAESVANAPRVLIAAGTGLGEGLLVCHEDGRYHPISSEGGHCDFAPRNTLEIGLLEYLHESWSHVSYERVLSGPGLYNIYRYLRHIGRPESSEISSRIESAEDPSAQVSELALSSRSETCREALRLFVSVYGAEAGNLALKAKALGGVFVGGGIAPKIRPMIEEGGFMDAFLDKGRMRPLLESIPVTLVLNSRMALIGAASCAAMHEES